MLVYFVEHLTVAIKKIVYTHTSCLVTVHVIVVGETYAATESGSTDW